MGDQKVESQIIATPEDNTERIFKLITEIVERSADGSYLFRGEPMYYPKVSSSLYRQYPDVEAEHFDIEVVQKEILQEAKKHTDESDDFEILTQLQHYGGKTNLIDFTTDLLTALFFACDNHPDKDGRIILQRREPIKEQLREPRQPGNRVISQKSIFVQPPKGFVEPDDVVGIPSDLKQPVLNYLRKYHGISTATIYNDLHGFITKQRIHESAYAEFYRGFTSQAKGGHDNAIADYNEALRLRPDYPEAYYGRGIVKQALDRSDEAIADYNEALRLKPDFPEAYNNRGNAKQALGRRDEAIADYNEALRLKPDFPEAYNNRGRAKQALDRSNEAIADYNEALRLRPDYPEAYNNRGNAKQALGRRDEAIADYNEALRLRPDFPEAYYNRGNAKQALGRRDEAIADYNEALRLRPDYPDAYYNRGNARLNMGLREDAKKDFQTALEQARKAQITSVAGLAEQKLRGLNHDDGQ